MQGPPSPLRQPKRVNNKRRAEKLVKKDSNSLGSSRSIADGAPSTNPPSLGTNQPSRQAVEQAVDELKLFVSDVDAYSELHRKGLFTVRLEKEYGKGDPPIVVPNNYIYYFGYEAFSFESTKFGSTIQASRMSEPDYFGALLQTQPEYFDPSLGTTVGHDSPVESCFLEMMCFVQPSPGEDTVPQPGLEELLEADRVEAAQASLEAGPEYLYKVFKAGMSEFLSKEGMIGY